MSLIPFTCDIQRDTVTVNAVGGEAVVSATIYTGLSATYNYYPTRGGRAERERMESMNNRDGPGLQTRTQAVVIFDPKPSVDMRFNDRVVPNPAVHGIPASVLVIGIRNYEVTLQLDVESVDSPTNEQ
jgi:hypothetical protein